MKLNAKDKAVLRSTIAQLVALGVAGSSKADRYLAAATSCDDLAERFRERAAELEAAQEAPKAPRRK